MADPAQPADAPVAPVCPWCSAPLVAGAATCASCGAILTSEGEPDLPGVTAVDSNASTRVKPAAPRNRLLSWISGEYPVDDSSASEARAVAPPDREVKAEILRLELEAVVANLQAEADALLSEAAADGRLLDIPPELQPLASAGGVADSLEVGEAVEDAPPA